MKASPLICALFLLSSHAAAADLNEVCSAAPRSHVEESASGKRVYSIHMGGRIDGESTRDPVGYWAFDQYWEPNVSVRLENTGNVPLVNPWIRRKDKPDTRTLASIVDSVITPGMSDSEKARRLWEFEIRNRFHGTSQDAEVQDAVKRFNAYGYTLCYDESRVMSDLWRAAGLKVRKGYPEGHSLAEVFYDGTWHSLDSDENILCLLRDNKTIASEEQIVADHDLMKRVHTYGPLHDHNPLEDDAGSASLLSFEGERNGGHPSMTRHSMAFTLRPGEAITWAWKHGGRYHGKEFSCCGQDNDTWIRNWRLPLRIVNGELSYSPDLTKPATLQYVEAQAMEVRRGGIYGTGLYLSDAAGSIVVPVNSAYPIVGGRLTVDVGRSSMYRQHVTASVSFDGGKTWRKAGATYQSDYSRWVLDLNDLFPSTDDVRYAYRLRLDFTSDAADPAMCLRRLHLQSTLQMAELALPGVSVGDNTFIYSDATTGAGKARITHVWRECDSVDVPGRPEKAIYPHTGGTASGTMIRFQWAPPSSGATPMDYQFQLSEFADMRWPLSPTFNRLVQRTPNRGTASFSSPYLGLLNPGQTYYWRVRARSNEGVWGAWSPMFTFSPIAPAVPANVMGRFDGSARTTALSWEPGENGTKPVRYRIYGSAERGFTASDTPYQFNAGEGGTKNAPPNLLLETRSAITQVELPVGLWRPYYRVAAIDAEDHESGPSNLAEVTHPLILTTTIPAAKAGSYYETKIETSASLGHLGYIQGSDARFRNGDEISFELTGAPKGLTISEDSGAISGFVPLGFEGKYEIVLTVSNHKARSKDSVKLVLQVGGP